MQQQCPHSEFLKLSLIKIQENIENVSDFSSYIGNVGKGQYYRKV